MAAAPFAAAAPASGSRPTICIFSKHMAQFGYEELGKKAKEVGFEGVDLTVRAKGHVEPEKAATDLPRAYDAIRAAGLSVPMITTGLLKAGEAPARPTLSTAAKLKIPFWKPGYYRYQKLDTPGVVERTLAEVKPQIEGLVGLSKEYGITCGFHNHSGDYVGAPVWDTRGLIANLDPKAIGYYLDPAHATIEGGLGNWRITMNMVAPRLKMVAMKDFYWTKANGKPKLVWCPMGEGMVDWPKVFANLKTANFTGPLTLHVEYETKDELAAIAKDFDFVRKQCNAVWGA
jgi:sugar phosphate isomerase/epimerase